MTSLVGDPQIPSLLPTSVRTLQAMELVVLVCCVAAVIAGPVQEPAYIGVQITTWNVNHKLPPENLVDVLGLQRDPDVLVLGLQKMAPSNPEEEYTEYKDKWVDALWAILTSGEYERTLGSSGNGISMFFFYKRRHNVSGLWTTLLDGGVSERIGMFGLGLNFVNADFTLKGDSLESRMDEFRRIENMTENSQLPKADYKFFLGDLNFQLKGQNDLSAQQIVDKISQGQQNELLEKDELRSAMKEGKVFKHYKESEISFPPTYKFELGTSRYDLSRRPAWTDRVLYRAAPGRDITTVYYGSISHLNISDHKPVEAFFRIPLGPKQNN